MMETTISTPENGAPGRRVITTLENIWNRIREHHPEIPPVMVTTGTGSDQKSKTKLNSGHHWDARWHHDPTGAVWGELFIAGELFNDGGKEVMETFLHEAAHALAAVRGIQDCSDEGRYHNRKFVALAVEMGLKECTTKNGRHGFNEAELTEEAAERYADIITELDARDLAYLVMPGERPGPGPDEEPQDQEAEADEEPVRRQGRRVTLICECDPPRRISLSYAQIEAGPLICGAGCSAPLRIPQDPA